MITEWIPTITNRNINDVNNAKYDPEENPKGVYNYTDLNRIENDTQYCLEYMQEQEIITEPISMRIKTNWTANEKVPYDEMERIITNIQTLGEYVNPTLKPMLPVLYPTTQMNYVLANKIEEYLNILHTQSPAPSDYYYLSVNHGIITTVETTSGEVLLINNSNTVLAEGEIATIVGQPYGKYASDQVFIEWESDPAEDVQYISDPTSQTTTYVGQGHDAELTAKFRINLTRTLTLTNAYISVNGDPEAESGPTSGTYYIEDQIMIIANPAPIDKSFDKWDGPSSFINTMSDAELHQSTVWITMPEEDLHLTASYVNAGPHTVKIYEGNTVISENSYEYDEYFNITAPNKGNKYTFSNWSGDTYYIDNIHNSTTGGRMPDIDLTFRANYNYNYSYNTVTMTDGTIDGQAELTLIKETTPCQIQCSPPEGYGFDYWSKEGAGSFIDITNATTTFIVGDGDTTITPHYTPIRELILANIDNGGTIVTSNELQGKPVTVNTTEVIGNYIFSHWESNGTQVSTSSIYTFNMPDYDYTIIAIYRLKTNVSVTINYGNHTETIVMQERTTRVITADTAPEGEQFFSWTSSRIYSIENRWRTTTSFVAGSSNGSITATYTATPSPISTYNLIVNNGTGSGTYETGTSVPITANTAPLGQEFDHWEITSGPGTISNIYSNSTYFNMDDEDATITARYKQIPTFDITVINGYVLLNDTWVENGTCSRNSAPQIKMKPAPEGYRFESWEILEGELNDVVQPLAGTTTLRNVTHNVTIKANYYAPDPATKYTLTIHNKDNTTSVESYSAGEEISVEAQAPDSGKKFYRWSGDYNYLMLDRSVANNTVKMPAKNIELWMTYVDEDYVAKYNLYMYNAECLISRSENPNTHEITETWSASGEFEEGTEIEIRPTTIATGWRFDGWQGATNEQASLIDNTEALNTFITISDFECHITAITVREGTYTLNITDGQVSGQYEADNPAPVYFEKTQSVYEDIKYEFTEWTGDGLAYIELYSGEPFDIYEAGSEDYPQYIKMPAKKINLASQFITKYHVIINNGEISETVEEYFAPNTTINIIANTPPTGYVFQRWEGDIDCVASKWDPTTTVTTSNKTVTLTAVYSRIADRNSIGYGLTNFVESDTINKTDITIVTGELGQGFIILDDLGHMYVVTSVDIATVTVIRLTKIQEGGNMYE